MTVSPSPSLASLRPRAHHPVLRRSQEAVQFGVGPGGAVEVSGGCATLRRLLLEWRPGQSAAELAERAIAAGVDEPLVRAVLARLCEAGALVDGVGPDRALAARAEASVLVSGDGPLLAGVAATLAATGVGRLSVAAEGTVLAEDVGTLGAADRGHPRRDATARAVHRVAPAVRCRLVASWPARGRVDLTVLTDRLHPAPLPSPVRTAPHLLVRLADGLGLVGPLVLPGRSACLRCLDLHRAAGDPCWPTVAADLAGRVGSGSPATVAATAALAAEQALVALDTVAAAGAEPPTVNGVLVLDPRRGTLRREHWPPHPRCTCGARCAASHPPLENHRRE